jgi:hypothetical protein
MLSEALAASFDLIWEVEDQPSVDVLRYQMSNNPSEITDLKDIRPFISVQEGLRCIFAGGPQDGTEEDDSVRYDITLFVKDSEITFTPNLKLIFKFEDRTYKLVDKDPNRIFGLIEFNLMTAD